ncbi:Vms1/Ankzf1 family peptidyl-tRNA hydrolase [Halolamina salifodinae]|uniref:Peptide subunit release factor 1 (ERF1) n=1 Tax=Halolamina salifodinae TaxID=1202767 RepID=A0A8T4H2L2_9EURY|nr:Vms1/Ankzf1 family peptidyl-tRNA hydrolase [Halolamina salifodinae]MBP1987865.1 peptide subunit release factor 1 (eRF1) [Halolamina salifodinae]
MLDRLLGRAHLKARIEELEEECESLQAQAESAKRSRAEAVSARQQAEHEINRLEDRITELEDRLSRAEGDGEADLTYRHEETARGDRVAAVADRLRSVDAAREGALTAFVADGDLPDAVRETLGDRAPLVSRAAPCLVCVDDAGLVATALSLPVEPDPFSEWDDSFRVEPEWVRPTGRLCFALVRSDKFALGMYEDGERVEFAGFESDVMNEHSKGGFSQDRFERRRDAQIEEHLERAAEAIENHTADADRVIVVGEKSVLGDLRDLADVTATVDATGDPEEALAHAFSDFWSVRVRGL